MKHCVSARSENKQVYKQRNSQSSNQASIETNKNHYTSPLPIGLIQDYGLKSHCDNCKCHQNVFDARGIMFFVVVVLWLQLLVIRGDVVSKPDN